MDRFKFLNRRKAILKRINKGILLNDFLKEISLIILLQLHF